MPAKNKLGHVTSYFRDFQGRLVRTVFPDLNAETAAFDSSGNQTNRVDRAGHSTGFVMDGLGRSVQTIFANNATNRTVYDDLGRTRFSVDARNFTNAFGYDLLGRRIALTNGLGTSVQMVFRYGFDANGNEITVSDPSGHTTTNIFDALNRMVEVDCPGGTKELKGYDGAGRRVPETNQDNIVTLFGADGLGRPTSVTNALGTTNQIVTRYENDEAGNQIAQIDALNHTNRSDFNLRNERVAHWMPDGTNVERFAFDGMGNQIRHTNFNGVVITNSLDVMNRPTNVAAAQGYAVSFGYSPTGQRTNMTDASGTTSYTYDERERLRTKTVSWTGGPTIVLNHGYDLNGNVTNIWSSTTNGVNLQYGYDPLNRITNVLANGLAAASYGFDVNGNLRSVLLGNGVTNLCEHDVLNRLTNSVWKSNQLVLASFYYQLGAGGNRTNLTETLLTAVTNRTYAWGYDWLYRLATETISGLGSTSYGLDKVGNRLNRAAGLDGLPAQNFSYTSNDWATTNAYDAGGNTIWTTNGGTATGPYYYDPENRMTNFNNSVFLAYNGDGARVKKTVGSTTTFFLLDDVNPSGYAQVLEEWTASGGSTNLARVYNYGQQLISQSQPGISTNYFLADAHHSTRLLVDSVGSVLNAFAFDGYGNLVATNASPQTSYLYAGQHADPDLWLYYLRARFCNPESGRFLTGDDKNGYANRPGSLHRYVFCEGDPVNNLDADGHEIESVLDVMDIDGLFAAAVAPPGSKTKQAARRVATGRPGSSRFWGAYLNYDFIPAEQNALVWQAVGGNLGKEYGPHAENSCATRVSYGLNYGGAPIPAGASGAWHNFPDQSYGKQKGDNKYYIINAGIMNQYLKESWGAPDYPQVKTVPELKAVVQSLKPDECAIFATKLSPGHSGVLRKTYQDPYVEGELPIDIWKLMFP